MKRSMKRNEFRDQKEKRYDYSRRINIVKGGNIIVTRSSINLYKFNW